MADEPIVEPDSNISVVSNDPRDMEPGAFAGAQDPPPAPEAKEEDPPKEPPAAADEPTVDEPGAEEEPAPVAAAGEGDDDAGEGDEPTDPAEKKRARARKHRASRTTRALDRAFKAEAENKDLRERLDAMEREPAPPTRRARADREPPPPKVEEETKAPKKDDFDDYEEYLDAKSDYRDNLREKKLREEVRLEIAGAFGQEREAAARAQQEEAQAQELRDWNNGIAEHKKTVTDWDAVISDAKDVPLSEPMRDFMLESDVGPQLLYELAKDVELAADINELGPNRAAVAMARLEARIGGNGNGAVSPPVRPTTKRPPPPIDPVGASAVDSTVAPDEMDYQAYKRYMDNRERRQREAAGGR